MYTFEGRIRYSETDPDGYLKMESLIDYFQDCSTFQSDDLGIGMEYLQSHHYAWLVNYWQLDIHRLPRWSERVVTGTSPYEIKGILGLRNFMMETQDGERLVDANSVWTLMDMDRMMPMRVPQEILDCYELYPKFEMEYTPRKIRIPAEGGVRLNPVLITEQYLDSNRHVNNGQYVRMAMAGETGGDSIRRLCVEYKKQARLGDTITPVLYEPGEPKEPERGGAVPLSEAGTAADTGSRGIRPSAGNEGEHLIALCAADDSVYAAVRIVYGCSSRDAHR